MSDYSQLYTQAVYLQDDLLELCNRLDADDKQEDAVLAHEAAKRIADIFGLLLEHPEQPNVSKLRNNVSELILVVLKLCDLSPPLHSYPDLEVQEYYEKCLWSLDKINVLLSGNQKWAHIHPLVTAIDGHCDEIIKSQKKIKDLTNSFYKEWTVDVQTLQTISDFTEMEYFPRDVLNEKYKCIEAIARKLEQRQSPTQLGRILEENMESKEEALDQIGYIAQTMANIRDLFWNIYRQRVLRQ